MDTPAVRLLRIDATSDEAWAVMPQVLRRLAAFCSKYPTGLKADVQTGIARWHFLGGSPAMGLWAALDSDGRVIGHLFGEYDTAKRTAFIYQLEMDRILPISCLRQGRRALDAWARLQGATGIEAATWHKPERWRGFGFALHRSVIRRELTDG